MSEFLRFPEGFIWGTATSAYQIEGAVNEDGRGPSIWDTFCRQPGKVWQGQTGDVASDHYHRWPEDIRLMQELGLPAYRFSIAWPRILPEGTGKVNPAGLDFYDRLVDGLREAGIEPLVTLYHWDLPQALQDRGGWTKRETAEAFAEYARIVAERLGDRVTYWITHNEPFVSSIFGHFTGEHAPGKKSPFDAAWAYRHIMLSHGLAVEALRATLPPTAQVGIVLNLSPVYPASDSPKDRQAAKRLDGLLNRMFLDPVLRGRFPPDLQKVFGLLFKPTPEDMKRIAAPIDFLGINYYTRVVARHDSGTPFIQAAAVEVEGSARSEMWEIYPVGMYEVLMRVHSEYRPARILVTENGFPLPDVPGPDGRVHDPQRIAYLRDHLIQVHRAISEGVPVQGYFVWSLLDNFEWAYGYRMRFGLVYVDYETQARTIKDSGRWFAEVVRRNGLLVEE
ncbi:MAG: GH1 family beta-glucosidase [Chloroflexia bacterium]